jgi:hypothetical protein
LFHCCVSHTNHFVYFQDGLSPAELDSLEEVYTNVYHAKYPVVGYMDYFVRQHPEKFNKDAKTDNDEL